MGLIVIMHDPNLRLHLTGASQNYPGVVEGLIKTFFLILVFVSMSQKEFYTTEVPAFPNIVVVFFMHQVFSMFS